MGYRDSGGRNSIAARRARLAVAVVALFFLGVLWEPAGAQGPACGRVETAGTAGSVDAPPTFVAAVTNDARSFHPYLSADNTSRAPFVYRAALWQYDPDSLLPMPEAAEAWHISDDRLTYTFSLRPDLRWSDGRQIVAADYAWTYAQLVKPEHAYPYRWRLDPIMAYEALDDRTVVIRMREARVTNLEAANVVVPLPSHVWAQLSWSDPVANPEIMRPTVVSGPYMLVAWERDARVEFQANPSYYREAPCIERYLIRVVPSATIALLMLKNGEVDTAGVDPDDLDELRRSSNVVVYEWWSAAPDWTYFGLNMRRPYLQDVRVRRSLAHAISVPEIAEHVWNNMAAPTFSIYPPSSWAYTPDVTKYPYDPVLANQLLDEAGWHRDGSGYRARSGVPLTLKLLYFPPNVKVAEHIATVAHQAWSDLGIRVQVVGMEWSLFLATLTTEPFDWDVATSFWPAQLDPDEQRPLWHRDSIPHVNRTAYVNERVEQLFDLGVREFDPERRKAVYGEIQKIITDDAPAIFLTYGKSYAAVSSRVGGIRPTRLGIDHNREQWYLR